MNHEGVILMRRAFMPMVLALLVAIPFGATLAQLSPREELGKLLYFDANLSTPTGQSCASCHHPTAGFADPDTDMPTSQGVLPQLFGGRNSPSAAYAAFSPVFHYDEDEGLYIGGQFWDGRAATLVEQAKGPFLNPLEMHNPNKKVVIAKVRLATYAGMFVDVYGPGALDNVEVAYDLVADAIAAYEGTSELNQFSSKYDCYLAGTASLSEQEMQGLVLYEGKANCAACHPSAPGALGEPPLFTDYTYDNLGVPKNPSNPFYYLPRPFNPDGLDFVDYGLGGVLGLESELGKMKVPTLRNIAVTPPYMHNGVFATLHEVVDFYNTRDVGMWPPPEVPVNVNTDELGDLGLTPDEVDDIVAFMLTLTDGWVPEAAPGVSPAPARRFAAALRQNTPNPFNPTTRISFVLPEASHVHLRIYDVTGREIRTLASGVFAAGEHTAAWDGADNDGTRVASGVYFYRLQAGEFTEVKKMVLLR